MQPIETVYLGATNYHGEPAEAFREEYDTYCRFILVVGDQRIVLMEYTKLS